MPGLYRKGCLVASHRTVDPGAEVDRVLAALKMYRQVAGIEQMWALVPPGVRFLAELLWEVEGLGPEYALEVALKTALKVQAEGEKDGEGI